MMGAAGIGMNSTLNQGVHAGVHAQILAAAGRRARVLLSSGAIVLAIAIVERLNRPYLPVGWLYTFPIVLVAGFFPRWAVALLSLVCALLSALSNSNGLDMLAPQFLALAGCGLFAGEWIRNRRLIMEAREKLRVLIETMPAAVFTVDDHGFIELANRAAIELVLPHEGRLIGSPIAAFFPELHNTLRSAKTPRTTTERRCYRGNGEHFFARVSCSRHNGGPFHKIAVVIADVMEETLAPWRNQPSSGTNCLVGLSDREAEVLRFLVQGLVTKEIAARMDISVSTVKNALQKLFAKTDVRTRAQLVKVALENDRDLLSGPASDTFPVRPLHRKHCDTMPVVRRRHAARREKLRANSAVSRSIAKAAS